MRTKGTIIPYEVFEEFREDIRALGHNHISNFNDANNDHIIIPMPKDELVGNLSERLIDGGFMETTELDRKFSSKLSECDIEISVNIKYYEEVNLF